MTFGLRSGHGRQFEIAALLWKARSSLHHFGPLCKDVFRIYAKVFKNNAGIIASLCIDVACRAQKDKGLGTSSVFSTFAGVVGSKGGFSS